MSKVIPFILAPEGEYSLKGACLPVFRTVRATGRAITTDLPDFLSECANEIRDAWEESKEEANHA
jgi:predicted RNA-binding Zn ribbon-like protein